MREVRPLPSSAVLLRTFRNDGQLPVRCPVILDAARDLVGLHGRYREASAAMSVLGLSCQALRIAADRLAEAAVEIDGKIAVIDHEIADGPRRDAPLIGYPARHTMRPPLHTETVGEVISRMAALWVEVVAHSDDAGDLPAGTALWWLCSAYDGLAEEVAAGKRRLPTRRPRA